MKHFPRQFMYICGAHNELQWKLHYCTTIGRVFEQFESIGLVTKKNLIILSIVGCYINFLK